MLSSPTTDRGRATLARILDAACALFAQQGIRATTLNQIGAAAGVGRGQLYHYYADKSDLVADVVAQQVERMLAAMEPRLRTMASADDMRAWCTEAVRLHASAEDPARCPMGSLVNELGTDEPRARAALAGGFARWHAALEAGLVRVAEHGELARGSDPGALASAVLAAYQGGVLLTGIGGDVEPLRRALDAVVAPALVG